MKKMMSRLPLFILVLSAAIGIAAPGDEVEQRLPVPDAKAQATAEATIKSVYKTDYAKRASADRSALAQKLIALADESRSDAVGRYVLLHEAEVLATQADDAPLALTAVDALSAAFKVDATSLKLAGLTRLLSNTATPAANRELAAMAFDVCEAAGREERFDDAVKAAGIASTAAERSADRELIAIAKQRAHLADRSRDQNDKANQALNALQKTPDDATATSIVGKYLCFDKEDWGRGVPYLAHVADESLHSVATQELTLPTGGADMRKLADGWWEWAEKAGPTDRTPARQRSAFWYAKALPSLSGLQKALAEKRMQQSMIDPGGEPRIIDLMPMIDTQRDARRGEWTLTGHTLTVARGVPGSKMQIDYRPPAEYDFRITFIRSEGNDAVMQMLCRGDHKFCWVMGGWDNTVSGFQMIGGRGAIDNATAHRANASLRQRVVCTSIVQVRQKSIAAYVNGMLISKYATDYSDLSAAPGWDDDINLGVGSNDGKVEFEAIELMEISGRGRREVAAQ